MKKLFFVSILLCLMSGMQMLAADFVPTEGKTYHIKSASGTYVEARTAGLNNPGAYFRTDATTEFTITKVGSAYTIQNAEDKAYLYYSTDKNWDTSMRTADGGNWAKEWTISEGAEGRYSIARKYNGTTYYLGNGNTNSGTGVYSGETSPVYFTFEEVLNEEDTTEKLVIDNPQAISDLLDRIGGIGTSQRFVTRLDENLLQKGKDRFVIGNRDGKPYVEGSSMTAIATGLNWYLNHDAHINISWNQLTADIASTSLPQATPTEKTCDAIYRYYLNYCTFGYSMTSWTWDRWQKEIDWMALHGINMPLQIIGMEKVWKDFLIEDYGYSENDAENFVAGPAFIAWWGMNNLEGWGGTHDDAWYERQADLARKICQRERELGMQPVLPGFSGMVPSNFKEKTGNAIEAANKWCGFQRPAILDPTGSEFANAAKKYYARLQAVMGTSKYYSMDPFHEGGTISSGKYSEGYKAVFDAMNTNCGTDTKWVIQQWQWASYQTNCISAVPAGRLIVLDLFADGKPCFDSYNAYAPQDAVFCTIPNFGGRSGFMGRLDNMSKNYFTFKTKYSNIKGIGTAPEAIESVPVVYDLLFELPWMSAAPNVTEWVADYATSRYGQLNANAQAAWENIHQSAMAFGADAIQGPIEDVWAARPNLDANKVSSWGITIANASSIYTTEKRQKLINAFFTLLGESNSLSGSNYQYDLIETGSQVMADYAYDLLLGIKDAKSRRKTELYDQRKDAFMSLILSMNAFKGTHQMFRLGNWTQMARNAANEVVGATTATPDWYELQNARTIITTWGDQAQSENGGLRDYSYRSWQGLLKDYYYPRWEYFFNNNCKAPAAGWFFSEWNWAHELEGEWGASAKGTEMKSNRTYYSPTPEGNTVEEADKLLQKYILAIEQNDKSTVYAYRALQTDLATSLTVSVEQGKALVMPILNNTDIEASGLTARLKIALKQFDDLTVPMDQATGTFNAEYSLSDGTSIKFKIQVLESTETAIAQLPEENCSRQGTGIYDLAGRQTSKTGKGLYIINEKKVVK